MLISVPAWCDRAAKPDRSSGRSCRSLWSVGSNHANDVGMRNMLTLEVLLMGLSHMMASHDISGEREGACEEQRGSASSSASNL